MDEKLVNVCTSFIDSLGVQQGIAKLRDFAHLAYKFKCLDQIHSLQQKNEYATIRDIFYSDVPLFHHQLRSDSTLQKLTQELQVSRGDLHIISTSKGFFSGNISITIAGKTLHGLSEMESRGIEIPSMISVHKDSVEVNISSEVKSIVVIEKDTIFLRLVSEGFTKKNREIVFLCSRGQPDISTRVLLHLIATLYSHLPIYALVDYDISGMLIASTLTLPPASFSNRKWYAAEQFVVPRVRILHPPKVIKDSVVLGIEHIDIKRSTDLDITKAHNLLQRLTHTDASALTYKKEWIELVSNMIESGSKFELDTLANVGDYILKQIYGQGVAKRPFELIVDEKEESVYSASTKKIHSRDYNIFDF